MHRHNVCRGRFCRPARLRTIPRSAEPRPASSFQSRSEASHAHAACTLCPTRGRGRTYRGWRRWRRRRRRWWCGGGCVVVVVVVMVVRACVRACVCARVCVCVWGGGFKVSRRITNEAMPVKPEIVEMNIVGVIPEAPNCLLVALHELGRFSRPLIRGTTAGVETDAVLVPVWFLPRSRSFFVFFVRRGWSSTPRARCTRVPRV